MKSLFENSSSDSRVDGVLPEELTTRDRIVGWKFLVHHYTLDKFSVLSLTYKHSLRTKTVTYRNRTRWTLLSTEACSIFELVNRYQDNCRDKEFCDISALVRKAYSFLHNLYFELVHRELLQMYDVLKFNKGRYRSAVGTNIAYWFSLYGVAIVPEVKWCCFIFLNPFWVPIKCKLLDVFKQS